MVRLLPPSPPVRSPAVPDGVTGAGLCRHPAGTYCGFCRPGPAGLCPHGDPYCPCQDIINGVPDPCHYEGNHPMQCPTTLIVGCLACR